MEAEQMLLLERMSSYLLLTRQRKNEIETSTRFVRQTGTALDHWCIRCWTKFVTG
jgi:hypothetical protein